MHKSLIKDLTDEQFKEIIESSFGISDAGKKFGFSYRPGKGARERILKRMDELNLKFKEEITLDSEIETKKSLYRNTKEIGFVGEKAFEFLCAKNRIEFFKEPSENKPYDYIVLLNNKILKIQIKTAEFINNGFITFDICRTNFKNGKYIKEPYTNNEIDLFFLYSIETDEYFLIPLNNINSETSIRLRFSNTKDHSKKKSNFAEDYKIINLKESLSSLSSVG